MNDLAISARKDAQSLYITLKEIVPKLKDVPPPPPPVLPQASDIPVGRKKQKIQAQWTQHRDQRLREWEEMLKLYLQNARSAFLLLWKKEHIEEKLKSLASYRSELNLRLVAVLNAKLDGIESKVEAVGTQGRVLQSQVTSQKNDIVEVLSINRSIHSQLTSVAAILKRQNGELSTVAPRGRLASAGTSKELRGINLIRYNADCGVDDAKGRLKDLVEDMPDFYAQIKNWLYFREESDRRIEVKEAHSRTFHWIFQDSATQPITHFANWLRTGRSCFWVNGKAGSGKSTLLKFIFLHRRLYELLKAWAGPKQLLICSFFFWNAGTRLQRTYEGVLRSILFQVLDSRPELTPVLFPQVSRYLLCKGDLQNLAISLQELQQATTILAKQKPRDLAVFLLVDGVDEFSGDHFEFSRWLANLAETSSIKILVSSRPIPACHQVFSRFPSLRLQDLTAEDISNYIEEELMKDPLFTEMDHLEPGFAKQVTEALLEKASGVFLWIILVVRDLLIGLGNYDDRNALMAKIDKLRNELSQLYDHMFGMMSKEYQQEGALLFRLVQRALQVQCHGFFAIQLSFIGQIYIESAVASEAVLADAADEVSRVKAVEGKLRSRCCGLVEVEQKLSPPGQPQSSQRQDPKVAFLHRTVTDFLRDPLVWNKITSLESMTDPEVDILLFASCIHTLKRRESSFTLPSQGASRSQALLSSCIEYSHDLCRGGNKEYCSFLEAADSTYMQYCLQAAPTLSPYLATNSIYGEVVARRLVPWPAKAILPDRETAAYSMLSIARLGVPEFFGAKAGARLIDDTSKSFLLLQLLWMIKFQPLDMAPTYLQNMETLLRCGARPDEVAKRMDSSYSRSSLPPFGAVAALADDEGRNLTPWNFWLIVGESTATDANITLLLINSGAELASNFEPKRKALQSLFEKLSSYCTDCPDAQTQTIIQQILAKMELARRKYDWQQNAKQENERSWSPKHLVNRFTRHKKYQDTTGFSGTGVAQFKDSGP